MNKYCSDTNSLFVTKIARIDVFLKDLCKTKESTARVGGSDSRTCSMLTMVSVDLTKLSTVFV